MTALINKLAAQPGEDEVLLVLDDYQLIDAEQVRTTLAFRLERLPAALHPALASRSDPPGGGLGEHQDRGAGTAEATWLRVSVISRFFWLQYGVGRTLGCSGQGTEVLEGVTGNSA